MRRFAAMLLCIVMTAALAACGEGPGGSLPTPVAPELSPSPSPEAAPEPTPEPTPEPSVVTLTLAGDIVMHTPLNAEVLQADGSYDYALLFEDVAHYVSGADYALCCIETVFTGEPPWTGYPLFSSPDDLAYSLKEVGFDLINTASNHAVDGFKPGIDRTLDVLDDAGLNHVGTYRTEAERERNNGILVREINGASIRGISFRLSLAFAALAAVSDRDTVKLLEAIMHDFDLLRDMEREDSFVKGFRCAAELRLPADRKEK